MNTKRKEEKEYREMQDNLNKHYPGVTELMELYGKYREVVEQSNFYLNRHIHAKITMSTSSID